MSKGQYSRSTKATKKYKIFLVYILNSKIEVCPRTNGPSIPLEGQNDLQISIRTNKRKFGSDKHNLEKNLNISDII